MSNPNPATKDIDISTQAGLDLLKTKAKYYGHYATFLKVTELIEEIERLRYDPSDDAYEESKKLGW